MTPANQSSLSDLSGLSTATLGEVGAAIVDASIRPLYLPSHVAGPAFTVSLPQGDNLSLHHALARAPAGSAMVVYCEGGPSHGFWGEITTLAARARGILGLITNGAVRDTNAIRRMAFPVFSGGVHVRGTVKQQRGAVGEPIVLGGVSIATGDFVIADSDGLVRIHPHELETTLQAAQAREAKEKRFMAALTEGTSTLQLLGLPDDQS